MCHDIGKLIGWKQNVFKCRKCNEECFGGLDLINDLHVIVMCVNVHICNMSSD